MAYIHVKKQTKKNSQYQIKYYPDSLFCSFPLVSGGGYNDGAYHYSDTTEMLKVDALSGGWFSGMYTIDIKIFENWLKYFWRSLFFTK